MSQAVLDAEGSLLTNKHAEGYLTATLTAIVNGHPQRQIGALLPWNYRG